MRFGLFTYRTHNLGDDIQSLAAMRFLPVVDDLIERDLVGDFAPDGPPVAVVMNGWFTHRPYSWPPPARIRPLLISMHLSPFVGDSVMGLSSRDFLLEEPALDYLRAHGPVGARDLHTLRALEERGVDAYFSGCLTLTLPRADRRQTSDCVVLNDVPDEVFAAVRKRTSRPILHTSHEEPSTRSPDERFAKARALLDIYSSAHCVITTRLHCALPCLAMGTPVLLLDVSCDQTRFVGLNTLVRHCTVDEMLARRDGFDVENPGANGSEHEPIRARLEETVRAFVASPTERAGVDPLALRTQTLVRIGALLQEKVSAATSARQRLEATVAELATERDRALEALGRATSERDALSARAAHTADEGRALVGALRSERDALRDELSQIATSTEWRAVSQLKRVLRRHPLLSAPARHLFNRIVKRIG